MSLNTADRFTQAGTAVDSPDLSQNGYGVVVVEVVEVVVLTVCLDDVSVHAQTSCT